MSGEWSKEVGDYGEKVVSRLLNLLGWSPYKHPVVVPCHRSDLHGLKTQKHGLDYLKYYIDPLYSFSQKTISVSAKYYECYPSDPTTMTKNFIVDLGKTMHCLKLDKDLGKYKIDESIREIQPRGLLFYLSHLGSANDSILDKITKFRNTEPVGYEPIYVIDNKIANFLYSSISHYKAATGSSEALFSYPCTEQNLNGYGKKVAGNILPLEFLNANILPMKLDETSSKTLFLYINETFSADSFSALIGFCHQYTNGWANKIIILFNEYRELYNNQEIKEVFSRYSDQSLIKNIEVRSFPLLDFHALEEN